MGVTTISDTGQKSDDSLTEQNDKSAENAADQQIATTASDVATSSVSPPNDNFWQSHWADSFTSKLKNITKMNPEELKLLSTEPQDPEDDIDGDPNAIPTLKDDTEGVKHLKKPPVDNTSRSIKVNKDKKTGGKQLSRTKKLPLHTNPYKKQQQITDNLQDKKKAPEASTPKNRSSVSNPGRL